MRVVVLPLPLLLAAGCAGVPADPPVHREIEESITSYLAAMERGDTAAAAQYWDPDIRLIGPGMDLDYAATMAVVQGTFAAGTRVEVLQRRTIELEVHGDVAFELAQAHEVLIPASGPPDTLHNNIYVRWKRGADGVWRFHRALLSPVAPPAPPNR